MGRGRRTRRIGFAVAFVACLGLYLGNRLLGEVRPGGAWAIGYGIAAAALLLAAAAYGARRRAMRWSSRLRLGTASAWLGFHVYGGVLFVVLMLMHSGFQLPDGWITWGLWTLALWTAASGLVGAGLQWWVPRQLASGLSLEVHYERIPELVAEVRERATGLAGQSSEPVRRLFSRTVAPALAGPRRDLVYLGDITGGIRTRLKEFAHLRGFLAAEDQERLDALARLYRTKLELDCHYTLQRLLRVWLFAHVPATVLLLGLLALHVFSVLYY